MNRLFELQRALLREIERYEYEPDHRDQPADWERVHLASSARIAYGLAERRGVDPELAACAAACHDYGRILNGRQAGHAEFGYEPVKEFLRGTGLFTEDEIFRMAEAVRNHSKKSEVSAPLDEIVKDADVLDMYQYGLKMKRREQKERLERLLGGELTELEIPEEDDER